MHGQGSNSDRDRDAARRHKSSRSPVSTRRSVPDFGRTPSPVVGVAPGSDPTLPTLDPVIRQSITLAVTGALDSNLQQFKRQLEESSSSLIRGTLESFS
eukprot:3517190-Karenia_brevis.AAC.1